MPKGLNKTQMLTRLRTARLPLARRDHSSLPNVSSTPATTTVVSSNPLPPTRTSTRRLLGRSLSATPVRKSSSVFQVDRGPVFSSYHDLLKRYATAKGSTSQRANDELVNRGLKSFFQKLSKSGTKLDTTHVADALLMLSYLHLPERVGFDVVTPSRASGMLPLEGRARFELIGQHQQRLDFKSLAELPWSIEPGTGYHIWDIRAGKEKTRAVVFRGTTSVGPGRDVKHGEHVASGALANGARDGIGAGVIDGWLGKQSLLSKHFDRIGLVAGHSLGAALAQDFVSVMLDCGQPAPFAYFGSAPSLSRPHTPAWAKNASRFFYTGSAQDPVMRGGVFQWPGRQMIAPWLDLPVQPGFANSMFDGLVTQHGVPVSIVKSLRGDDLVFTDREARPSLEGDHDPESFPLDLLGAELADRVRPSVTAHAFKPTVVERIMANVRDLGVDTIFRGENGAGERGADYSYFIHLTKSLLASQWVVARYDADPLGALLAIAGHRADILSNPEKGLRELKKSLAEIIPDVHFADDTMKAAREVLKLIGEVRRDLQPEMLGSKPPSSLY